MTIANVTDQDFEEKVLKSQKPILVDFWAAWCGPCKLAEPVLDELASEYEGRVDIVKVDVDANRATSEKYQIMSIPTTILFKGGQEIGRQIGFSGKESFEELMKKGL